MNNILVIYHHKTGCVLIKDLFLLYKKYIKNYNVYRKKVIKCKHKIKNNEIIKEFDFDLEKFSKSNNVFLQASPYFLYDIKKELKFNKIIHFVRDPYEQAVSNFNYHTLEPTPEEWFLNIHNQVYKWFSGKDYLKLMFDILDLDITLITKIEKYLKKIYKPIPNYTYYEILLEHKSINEDKALIIETFRFIFETKHILKMACIAKINKNKMLILSLKDFKTDKLNKTINTINNFLFENKNIPTENLIESYLKKYNSNKNTTHISKISEQKKLKQINVLKNNIFIKTIFDRINELLYS